MPIGCPGVAANSSSVTLASQFLLWPLRNNRYHGYSYCAIATVTIFLTPLVLYGSSSPCISLLLALLVLTVDGRGDGRVQTCYIQAC